MNLFSLVLSYLRARPLNTILNVVLLSLGIAVITILLLFSNQLKQKIADNTKGIDLVVGAKGSPLQLILCNIFHIDYPTGNISLKEAERLARNRLVKTAIPLALGDSYQNYRIVGTIRQYTDLYEAKLASGEWWRNNMEVVIGANCAHLLNLKVGDKFESSHGLTKEGDAHDAHPFLVKGILTQTGSVIDNLILTNVASIWEVHETHDEEQNHELDTIQRASLLVPGANASDSTRQVTSLLIKYRNPIAAIQLPRFINGYTNMQAASPAFEAARLFSILGVGVEVLNGFAYVLIVISALSIFIALYNSLKERKYDLAIMRSMGATKSKLFFATILEGTTLTLLGSIIGLLLGHVVLYFFGSAIEESQKAGITSAIFYVEEVYLLAGSILLGIVCSLIPAFQAYRTDIHKVLAGN